MLSLLLLAAAAATEVPPTSVPGAAQAIAGGRFEQARTMIAAALAKGAKGDPVDRLLADLAFASRKDGEALIRYQALLESHPDDPALLEHAAISAIRVKDLVQAKALADRAIVPATASWRAWNARAVIADLEQDFETADTCYARALALEPDQPKLLNNVGWSRLLRGDWNGAIEPLERAATRMPASSRATNNLELARMALASDLPQRRPGEAEDAWASRLNDAGVAAQLRGAPARAIAAFSQALVAHGSWYERAANNLAAVNGQQ